MKKIFALMVSYFGLFSGLCAQAVPHNYPSAPRSPQMYYFNDLERVGRSSVGYLDLRWGSSADRLFKLFPNCEEITDESDEEQGIQRYIEEIEDLGIESREFVYFQDKLYEVYVLYGYVDEQTPPLLKTKLEAIYGKISTTTNRVVRSDTAVFKMVDRYMDYSRDLQVVFTTAEVYDNSDYKLGTTMTCLYVNRELKREAERPQLNIRPLPKSEF